MKKFILCLLIIFAFSALPAWAATQPAASKPKTAWNPSAPDGYSPITWAKAPGIASFYKEPTGNGTIDFLTRLYLPQNQIGFIVSGTPLDLGADSSGLAEISYTSSQNTSTEFSNLSFERFSAEAAKKLDKTAKFIWDASFFNMKPGLSELSMAVKYTVGATTTITSGSRSIPDMAKPRRLLMINNQKGVAAISDFDSNIFTNNSLGDQALEGFAPTVAISDDSSAAAARLFLGVSDNGKELVVYCSQQATVEEASNALLSAGIPLESQLQADGGGSAACGYNLPGQFFVEPKRSLPLLMGATTILSRGTVASSILNVRGGPAVKYPIIAKLSKGAAIRAYEEKNGWYRIGDNQWVIKSSIKKI